MAEKYREKNYNLAWFYFFMKDDGTTTAYTHTHKIEQKTQEQSNSFIQCFVCCSSRCC